MPFAWSSPYIGLTMSLYQEKCLDCANITVLILAIPGTAQKHWKNAETCSRLVLHNTVSLLGAQSKELCQP